MGRFLTLLVFLMLYVGMEGQYTYFNNSYHTAGVLEFYGEVMVHDSLFVLGGGFFTDTSSFLIRTHDFEGNIVSNDFRLAYTPGVYYVSAREMVLSESGMESFIYSSADIGNGNEGFLMKMNADFDTLWTNYYSSFPSSNTNFRTGLLDQDGLIMTAFSQLPQADFGGATKLVKLDLDGNVIWSEFVAEFVDDELPVPWSTIKSSEGYVTGGTKFRSSPQGSMTSPFASMSDFDGQLLWTYDVPVVQDAFDELGGALVAHSNGSLYMGSFLGYEEFDLFWVYSMPILRELDPLSGEVLNEWEYYSDNELIQYSPQKIIESHDGELLMMLSSTYYYTTPLLMKLDTEGNVLWTQEYSYDDSGVWENQIFHDIEATPDGGYIMAGELVHEEEWPLKRSWVVKVDGCGDVEWMDCQAVGLSESEVIGSFSVYPNPTRDRVSLEVEAALNARSYQLHDAMGSSVREGALRGSEKATIDLSGLSSGVFLIRLFDGAGELIGTQRLVKLDD